MIIDPTRQIVVFGFILLGATVLVVGIVQFFWPQLGRLVKRALWLSLIRSPSRLQRLFGGSVRLKWAEEEEEEDSESMRPTPLQDGVYQLDGRIVKEDQYPIAGGGNANIFRGTLSRSDGRKIPVAIKVLRHIGDHYEHQATLQRMEREVQVWSEVKHPNLLPFFGICKGLAPWPVLVSPFYEFGHVGEYLKKFPEADRLALTVGAATGLTYLHSRKMIHGDLKVQNVLVDASGRAVICDFGLSKIIDKSGYTTSCVGTVAYMAPELFTVLDNDNPRGARTTKATDVYSFGLLGLEIYSSQRPKRRATSPIVTKQTLAEMQPKREDVPVDTVPPVLWYLFERCCHAKPHLRPSMTHVLRSLETFGRSLSRQRKRTAQNSKEKNPLWRLLPHLVAGPSTAAVSAKTTYMCRFDRPQSCSFEVDDFVPTDAPTLADRHTLHWIPETNKWAKMEDGLTPRILDEVERGKYAEAVEACRVDWAWDDPDVNDEL
ncbi:kinase-like domain-containing protein [Mycena metata]|uniref:Kinase-like domain-containing protein n=1 Tax=Mycena metata TaxID=1033252 RepID=A0AAD7IY71_9AGAR|nr:kinase-like domain-containing protein [Mycena metata]